MRFILFNIVVGVALIYLFNGDTLSLRNFEENLGHTKAKIEMLARTQSISKAPGVQSKNGKKVFSKGPTQKTGPGSTIDKINTMPVIPGKRETPVKQTVRVVESKKPKHVPYTNKKTPIAGRDDQSTLTKAPNPSGSARAETAKPDRYSKARIRLKEGASMMSTSERRQELGALAEEMEMLYIKKIGG